jgi:hypothetical protein
VISQQPYILEAFNFNICLKVSNNIYFYVFQIYYSVVVEILHGGFGEKRVRRSLGCGARL